MSTGIPAPRPPHGRDTLDTPSTPPRTDTPRSRFARELVTMRRSADRLTELAGRPGMDRQWAAAQRQAAQAVYAFILQVRGM